MSDGERDEAQRLLDLMNDLVSDVAYAVGDRAFPAPVSVADATFITAKLHEAIEEGTAVRDRIAEQRGVEIACRAGCTYCCEQPILVWLPEAILVADHLRLPENAAARERFLAAYPAWRSALGEGLDRMVERGAERDAEGYLREHHAVWRKRVLCAFNHDGLCAIYAVRPVACRNHHAVGSNEHCRADDDSGIPASHIQFKPLDEFISRAKRVTSAMHHAIGGGRMRMVILCQEVHDLLSGAR